MKEENSVNLIDLEFNPEKFFYSELTNNVVYRTQGNKNTNYHVKLNVEIPPALNANSGEFNEFLKKVKIFLDKMFKKLKLDFKIRMYRTDERPYQLGFF